MKSVVLCPMTLTRRAIISIQGLSCHVHPRCALSGVRSVHSDTSAVAPAADDRAPFTSSTWNQAPRTHPRQATFLTRQPAITSRKDLLKALKTFRPTSKLWEKFAQDPKQAVVILATPSFSKWLEDDSFIADFLARITRAASVIKEKIKDGTFERFEMDVLCACVDGISPQIDWFSHEKQLRPRHGFSILMGRTSEILPNLWDTEESITASSPTMTASLTFPKARTSRSKSHVVLPLANTLFSNGRHSTLLVSKWRVEKDAFVKVGSVPEKRNQIINAFGGRSLTVPSAYVPAIPLTPARRITSGLGNIVKQIDFGSEGAGPASRELEANIDSYLSQSWKEKSTIAVWALVIPEDSLPHQKLGPLYELLYETDSVKSQWQGALPNLGFIGYWLSRGARFCRVLSGGGGWGVKQGLLSLDPQSTYGEVSEARFDFSTASLKEQQTSALGKIAEPGAYIQFFVADDKIAIRTPVTPADPEGVHSWRTSTVFGTVPSTIDDQLVGEPHPKTEGQVNIFCQPGHFGAVSEAGIFLGADSIRRRALRRRATKRRSTKGLHRVFEKSAIRTKIDLPYSYMYRDFRLEAKPAGFIQSKSSTPAVEEPEMTVRGVALNRTFRKVLIGERPADPLEPAPAIQEPEMPTFQVRKHFARSESKTESNDFSFLVKFRRASSEPKRDLAQQDTGPDQKLDLTSQELSGGPSEKPAPSSQEQDEPAFRVRKPFVSPGPVMRYY